MEQTISLFTPLMQLGFAGFCLVQTAIIVWLITRLLAVIKTSNEVLDRNTQALMGCSQAVSDMDDLGNQGMKLLREVNDKLLARPCLIEK